MRPIEPVMFPAAAGMPPQVAQVPIAIVAAARGAMATTQSVTRAGWPAERVERPPCGRSAPVPSAARWPELSAWSSGIDPSRTRMYGSPSVPSAAAAYAAVSSCPDSSEIIG